MFHLANLSNPNMLHNYDFCKYFSGPACEKAWIYERVPGFELAGYDDRTEKNILTRKECQELCLAEKSKTGLTCRSAEYEYKTYTCRISQVRLFFINTLG